MNVKQLRSSTKRQKKKNQYSSPFVHQNRDINEVDQMVWQNFFRINYGKARQEFIGLRKIIIYTCIYIETYIITLLMKASLFWLSF